MTRNKKIHDKFYITMGILILINISIISWCIFLLVQKPRSYIIAGISALIYLLYEMVSIVLMEKL